MKLPRVVENHHMDRRLYKIKIINICKEKEREKECSKKYKVKELTLMKVKKISQKKGEGKKFIINYPLSLSVS